MLFNYKDSGLCCEQLHLLGDLRQSHPHSRDLLFLTPAVLVATLLAGMILCVSYVVVMVGL